MELPKINLPKLPELKKPGEKTPQPGEWGFENKHFGIDSRYIKAKKHPSPNPKFIHYSRSEELVQKLGFLDKGERAFVVTNGNSEMSDFLEAFIVEHNLHVKKLRILNPSISENGIQSLLNLIDGEFVDSVDLALSEDFRKTEIRPGGLIPLLYNALDVDNKVQIAFAGSHAKIITIETYDGLFYTIHGSANLRANSNIEQFEIEESEKLTLFNSEIIDCIVDRFYTIAKERNWICDVFGVRTAFENVSSQKNKATKTGRKRSKEIGNTIPLRSIRGKKDLWTPIVEMLNEK